MTVTSPSKPESASSSVPKGASSSLSSYWRSTSSILTNSAAFARLSRWAFNVCDADETGQINQAELYAGILLVHVNLAKYAGAAACYPPTRAVVDDLFAAADADNSGSIEEAEFLEIVQICSMDIASRIVVYYSILILLVPYLADVIVHVLWQFDDWMLGGENSKVLQENAAVQYLLSFVSWKEMTDRVVSMALFFLVIPMLFDAIDKRSKSRARKTKSP
uniref:EF-hand domain-containing protein n=1 Tax=Amphora coffeiformis TaxID=265554 RepID=A0A7S3L406_9STRA|mmetsp:Transcript_26745/g.50486  ORF Transcript_26745/g.50486 Transcript_26745/m.50486 type:complete len:220 (+) Transcript_26745:89-748(+)|eukprot:scaffold3285_cov140-Amphora_coffeaeformis.AAC.5